MKPVSGLHLAAWWLNGISIRLVLYSGMQKVAGWISTQPPHRVLESDPLPYSSPGASLWLLHFFFFFLWFAQFFVFCNFSRAEANIPGWGVDGLLPEWNRKHNDTSYYLGSLFDTSTSVFFLMTWGWRQRLWGQRSQFDWYSAKRQMGQSYTQRNLRDRFLQTTLN